MKTHEDDPSSEPEVDMSPESISEVVEKMHNIAKIWAKYMKKPVHETMYWKAARMIERFQEDK